MIISDQIRKPQHAHNIVIYDIKNDGTCYANQREAEFATIGAEEYMETRRNESQRLIQELFSGKISPVCFFFSLQHMSEKDLASRLKLPVSKIKKHFTPEGFNKVDIATLNKYAVVFDIAIGDFFDFIFLKGEINQKIEIFQNRIIQKIELSK